jgi:glycosyltransferase involved in cell wall biosynthesis
MDYVLIITIHADPAMAPGYEEWGGTHTYMKELLDGFGTRKIHCLLVTRKCMPFPDVEQYNEYCKVIRLNNGKAEPIDKSLLQNFHEYNLAQIQLIIDKYGKPIIIHSVYWNSGRLAMELGKKNNVPFVHSVISNSRGRIHRGADEPVPKRAEYEQQIYERAKWILCVSEDERQDIIHFYNIVPEKVCVVGQYIHDTFYLPAHNSNGFPRLSININTEENEKNAHKYNTAYTIQTDNLYWNHKVFTYVGRIDLHKGIDRIIKAWYRLYKHCGEKACPPLWMAGGSVTEIHNARSIIKDDIPEIDMLEENRLLVWWGYLDPVGLSTILLKTLVMITHSLYEPGGRVIVEAMSEGVPVIATPNGFAKDYIVNWRNGFLVAYGDNTGLYLRLQHFLRQPFLSDALGQNSRQDAKKIIKKWNFFDGHLIAYGMQSTEIPTAINGSPDYDYFKVRKINLFPYHNFPLSETYIKEFVVRLINEPILECIPETNVASTSDIFRIKTNNCRIIVKRVFTRLRIGPMVNPFDTGCYVKKAVRSFRVELNAYQQSKSNVILGYDELHYLLAFKELEPIENNNLTLLKECIDYIMHKTNTMTEIERTLFLEIVHKDSYHHANIAAMYHQLEQKLPNYDFEQSGRFSEVISWASAPFILDYNQDSFPDTVLHELRAICIFFYQYVCHDTEKTLRSINEDIQFKHFLRNNGCLELIDLEKTTIGCVETELAGLLYSYWYTIDNNITITKLLDYVPENLNRRKIVSSMAYICFYDIQVFTVMQRKIPNFALTWLRVLYQVALNITQQ